MHKPRVFGAPRRLAPSCPAGRPSSLRRPPGAYGAKQNTGRNSNLAAAAALIAVFKPEEPSSPLTPEREAARQLLNDEEHKILEAMESDLSRPLTEEEERLAVEPGALIEQPRPKNPLR